MGASKMERVSKIMMSDEMKTVSEAGNEVEVEDFSQLLKEQEQAVGGKTFEKGQIVEGVIVQIGSEAAYVNIGAKSEAMIPVAELLDPEEGKVSHVVGEMIKAKVIGFDGSCIKLSRSNKVVGSIALEEAWQAGLCVKARVKAVIKGGFELDVFGHRAFCPLSQIQKGKVENPEALVGQSFDFKIIKFAKKGRDLVLSRTALMADESNVKREEALAKLEPGMVLDAKVVSLQDYGAFVDIGDGVDGLVHVSEISYGHIKHPNEVLQVGQEVKVVVLNVEEKKDASKKNARPTMKLSLSMKRLESDPFTEAFENIKPGARLSGKVVRTTNFGAFVELAPGIEGLAHVSELGWKRNARVEDFVKVGDTIEVIVLSVDADARRISLSCKGASENPWTVIDKYYQVGQEVTGSVESTTDFGVFVKLEHGITALLPKSEVGEASKDVENAKKGDALTAKIIVIDPERKRVTLSTKAEGEKSAAPRRAPRSARYDDEQPREERRPREDRRSRRDNSESYDESASFNSFGSLFAGLKKK